MSSLCTSFEDVQKPPQQSQILSARQNDPQKPSSDRTMHFDANLIIHPIIFPQNPILDENRSTNLYSNLNSNDLYVLTPATHTLGTISSGNNPIGSDNGIINYYDKYKVRIEKKLMRF